MSALRPSCCGRMGRPVPILSEYRRFYSGPGWRAVRARIRARANDACEQCGVPNHVQVIRRGGAWWDLDNNVWYGPDGGYIAVPPNGLIRRVDIVCTVAHLNHRAGDDRDENLRFLCQSCHLAWDRGHHKESRSARKDRGRPLLQML